MTTERLLRWCDRHEVRLELVDGKVQMRAPRPLKRELVDELRRRRNELVELLRERAAVELVQRHFPGAYVVPTGWA